MAQPAPPSLRPSRRRLAAAVRWLPSVALLALALGLGAAFMLGCASAEQRYKVLSFFFDGVPPPQGYQGPVYDLLAKREQVLARAVQVQRPTETAEQKITWYHQPYVQRQCFDCHEREAGYGTPDDATAACRRCHDSYFEIEPYDWVHGPVASGECGLCHEPHQSEHQYLLTEGQPALCFECHDPGFVATDPYHAALGPEPVCSDCHDPHAAGNRLLLADSRTYQRRMDIRRVERSEHAAWERSDCARCHQTEQGNRVVDDVDRVCLECHEPVIQQAQANLANVHEPITEGKCTACHTPHRSPRPALLLPTAERTCYGCHDPAAIRTPEHPNVTRVDCVLCHRGHGGDNPHLLRDELTADLPEGAGP